MREVLEERMQGNIMKCPRCNGRMRVIDTPTINDDGTMPCPRCEGEGEI